MNHEVIGGIVNNLPIEKMVAAPLLATIKAQSEMSMALANFVENVGLDKDGNIRMVTFNYSEATADKEQAGKVDRHIEAPFIALTGIPNLAVEDVSISFDLTVNTAESQEDKTETKADNTTEYKSWWSPISTKFTGSITHSSNQTRSTDTRAKYSFNVNARKQGTPEALMRIIDTITDSVATPLPDKKTDSNLLPEKEEVKQPTPKKTEKAEKTEKTE